MGTVDDAITMGNSAREGSAMIRDIQGTMCNKEIGPCHIERCGIHTNIHVQPVQRHKVAAIYSDFARQQETNKVNQEKQ